MDFFSASPLYPLYPLGAWDYNVFQKERGKKYQVGGEIVVMNAVDW